MLRGDNDNSHVHVNRKTKKEVQLKQCRIMQSQRCCC